MALNYFNFYTSQINFNHIRLLFTQIDKALKGVRKKTILLSCIIAMFETLKYNILYSDELYR